MRHEEAWRRLPDLLDDRDDVVLLAHVRECSACQRQLFVLGRVDRLLRDRAAAHRSAGKRPHARIIAAAAAVAAVAAATLALFLPQQARTHEFMLRTASGRLVGQAKMGSSAAGNVSPCADHAPSPRQPWRPLRALGRRRELFDEGRPLHGRSHRRLPRPLQPPGNARLAPVLGHRTGTSGSHRQHVKVRAHAARQVLQPGDEFHPSRGLSEADGPGMRDPGRIR